MKTITKFSILALIGLGLWSGKVCDVLADGMLTYSFDDGYLNVYQKAAPILEKYNQVAAVNVVLDWMHLPEHMKTSHLISLEAKDWEICSHSISHPHFSKIPLFYTDEVISGWTQVVGFNHTYQSRYVYEELPFLLEDNERLAKKTSIFDVESNPGSFYFDEKSGFVFVRTRDGQAPVNHEIRADSIERELEWSRKTFNALGLSVKNFAVPYSDWKPYMATISKDYYNGVVSGGQKPNNIPLSNPWWLNRMSVTCNTTVDDVIGWIDQYVLNGDSWLILMFHGIDNNFSCETWPESNLDQLAYWVQNQDIEVVTLQKGLEIAFNEKERPICDIQVSQSHFVKGDVVTAKTFEVSNPSADAVAVEWKVWLQTPESELISIVNIGADGSFTFPAGFNFDFGPVELISTGEYPTGLYELNCRMLDPLTGERLTENFSRFFIHNP